MKTTKTKTKIEKQKLKQYQNFERIPFIQGRPALPTVGEGDIELTLIEGRVGQ